MVGKKQTRPYGIFEEFRENNTVLPYKLTDVELTSRCFHPYQDHVQFLNGFLQHFGKHFNMEMKTKQSCCASGDDLYNSSRVYYETDEICSSSANSLKPKRNKHYLCPLCDPFAKVTEHHNEITAKGQEHVLKKYGPSFYDTLHSGYFHHMAFSHGVFKKGVAKQPFVGLSMTPTTERAPSGVYKLCAICSYNKKGTNEPCLAACEFLYNKENPYKNYFRHVDKCHFREKPDSKKFPIYEPEITDVNGERKPNVFYPISIPKYVESLKDLRERCCDPSILPFVINDKNSQGFNFDVDKIFVGGPSLEPRTYNKAPGQGSRNILNDQPSVYSKMTDPNQVNDTGQSSYENTLASPLRQGPRAQFDQSSEQISKIESIEVEEVSGKVLHGQPLACSEDLVYDLPPIPPTIEFDEQMELFNVVSGLDGAVSSLDNVGLTIQTHDELMRDTLVDQLSIPIDESLIDVEQFKNENEAQEKLLVKVDIEQVGVMDGLDGFRQSLPQDPQEYLNNNNLDSRYGSNVEIVQKILAQSYFHNNTLNPPNQSYHGGPFKPSEYGSDINCDPPHTSYPTVRTSEDDCSTNGSSLTSALQSFNDHNNSYIIGADHHEHKVFESDDNTSNRTSNQSFQMQESGSTHSEADDEAVGITKQFWEADFEIAEESPIC